MVDQNNVMQSSSHHHGLITDSNGGETVAFLPYSAFDTSRIATYVVSVALIVYGSFRSLNLDSQHGSRLPENGYSVDNRGIAHRSTMPPPPWCHWHILGSWQAALMPLAASVSLLVMFLYFESLQLIFVIATCVLATAAFAFLLLPLCQFLFGPCTSANHHRTSGNSGYCLSRYQPSELAAALLGASLVALWLVTGHWLLMDLLAMGLCVAFIALVRLPSLKVSTLLLVGLLLYDIFWVFFSSYLFSTNVMVRVATRQVDSPLAVLVATFGSGSTPATIPMIREPQFVVRSSGASQQSQHNYEHIISHQHFMSNSVNTGPGGSATKLSLPGKLVFPSWQSNRYTMLGLGDIVVPGLLLCFVLRYDAFKRRQQLNCKSPSNGVISGIDVVAMPYGPVFGSYSRLTYFRCSLMGYFLGLITATICSEIFRSAQPALLYLVPFTLIPLIFMSYLRGDLRIMWNFSGIHGAVPEYAEAQSLLKSANSTSSPALLAHTVVEGCTLPQPCHHCTAPPPAFDSPPPYDYMPNDSLNNANVTSPSVKSTV